MEWLIKFLKDLSNRAFYGKITISMVNGKIDRIEKYSSHKPPDTRVVKGQ